MPIARPEATNNIADEIAPNSAFQWLNPRLCLALLLLVIVYFGLIRYRLRSMPLERDEGEYAYSGQLLLQGIPPYKLAYNMKLPGIYSAYAAILAVFGETPEGIHLGLIFVNAATTLFLYFLTSVLFGRMAALIAATSLAMLSTSSSVLGFAAHATNFVILPALLGMILLLLALRSGQWWLYFFSGLCAGIAILMKQHGVFFALFCLAYLRWPDASRKPHAGTAFRRNTAFISGVLLPYLVTCWLLYRAGVFRQFWFWTVSYAGEYSKIGTHRAVRAFLENARTVIAPALPMWILAVVGLTALFRSEGARKHIRFVGGLFLFSFLALCPGGYFRPHYFVLLLPVIAILVGIAIHSTTEKLAEYRRTAYLIVPSLIFLASLGYAVFQQRATYFSLDALAVSHATYPDDPFIPAMEVARYVKENSPESSPIAVLGSEPEIYFYAHRHSVTGFLYMYSLIGKQKYTARMRDDMMHELESDQPEYVIYVDNWNSWGDRAGVPQAAAFLSWLAEYMHDNYQRIGVADIRDQTHFIWGDAAMSYVPQSSSVIYTLKKKE